MRFGSVITMLITVIFVSYYTAFVSYNFQLQISLFLEKKMCFSQELLTFSVKIGVLFYKYWITGIRDKELKRG